ncbi:Helix-turn-helix [Veillonella atypica]|uniref:Helix-turn-helix n=1 Tax=Veillonella atypica TaxID=39777 RepID=A0A6N2ZJ07_9FIRM|nr:helix-turn-helix transcriptional regulator [Veillonella sp.]DAJ65442.1 MAG TPA: Cro/C1-type HTH DNA-binding domain protein [Caudoviricetes sp.]
MKQKEFTTRMYGEAIRERMQELNMSKADLIRASEVSRNTLNRALEGKSVQMATIAAICDALGVSRDEYNDFWETDYYNPKFDRP